MEEINANVNNSNALATAEADAETLGTPPRKSSLSKEFSPDSWIDVLDDTTDLTPAKDAPDPFLIRLLVGLWSFG